MRLAFSTLGVPGMPPQQVRELALRTGWTGLELLSSLDEPLHTGLDTHARAKFRRELGPEVTPVGVNSYVHVGASHLEDEDVITAILSEAELARDIGAAGVRVFPGGEPDESDERLATRLRAAAGQLPAGVQIWLETHDSHSTGRQVADVLERTASPHVRAIWDLAHTVHGREPWQETVDVLRPHLAHVQIKDEVTAGSTPVALGCGTLPVAAALTGLLDTGYAGWTSLEWERKWFPEAEPLEGILTHGRTWIQDNVLS
ncbi:sugar phosphate isomerase/epimerase family protein [Streptomyces sp. NPDC060194]|uniref:sugar phosphate isomerase/epimerase family protein n=1 Tax=Streptomyces sp. NPDC060194 TaxID=3347069 RepID=UPI0036482027